MPRIPAGVQNFNIRGTTETLSVYIAASPELRVSASSLAWFCRHRIWIRLQLLYRHLHYLIGIYESIFFSLPLLSLLPVFRPNGKDDEDKFTTS